MSHLKYLTFDNYRIFENKTEIQLKPITFLTGPNSSGKSSILKSLLLLKSNYNSDLQVLDFTGPKHNLGTFDNTLNKKNSHSDIMTFGFQADITGKGFSSSFIKEPKTTKRSVYNILKEYSSKDNAEILIELTYKKNERSGKLIHIEIFVKGEEVSFLKLDIGNIESESHNLKLDVEQIQKNAALKSIFFEFLFPNDYKLKNVRKINFQHPTKFSLQENSKIRYYDEPILIFSRLYEQFIKTNIISENQKSKYHQLLLAQPLKRLLKDFASIIDNTEYLEAVRANTKRLYTNDSQGTSFNDLILDYKSRDISPESLNFTNKWLQKFEIADEIIFENVEGVATTIYLKKGDEKIALADLGYGITQFLPIILKIALEEPIRNTKDLSIVKKLILLEEPETNLHPKLQSLISDFLIDSLKTFEVRFIIETHSEYIIRKIQILIAEKELSHDNSIIYYFNTPNSNYDDQLIKIKINENGSLDNDFGAGFFDEATNLKFELLKLKTKKND